METETRVEQSNVIRVSEGKPRPLRSLRGGETPTVDWVLSLALEGAVFVASDADQDDTVTGQTSFADTTPTFLLSIPQHVTCVPLYFDLAQTAPVAGGVISVIAEVDRIDRYASGGTEHASFNTHTGKPTGSQIKVYENPTAASGYGQRVGNFAVGQDISPAEGQANGIFWTPRVPFILQGPASFLVYTWAATTGPNWFWTFGWAELDVGATK